MLKNNLMALFAIVSAMCAPVQAGPLTTGLKAAAARYMATATQASAQAGKAWVLPYKQLPEISKVILSGERSPWMSQPDSMSHFKSMLSEKKHSLQFITLVAGTCLLKYPKTGEKQHQGGVQQVKLVVPTRSFVNKHEFGKPDETVDNLASLLRSTSGWWPKCDDVNWFTALTLSQISKDPKEAAAIAERIMGYNKEFTPNSHVFVSGACDMNHPSAIAHELRTKKMYSMSGNDYRTRQAQLYSRTLVSPLISPAELLKACGISEQASFASFKDGSLPVISPLHAPSEANVALFRILSRALFKNGPALLTL